MKGQRQQEYLSLHCPKKIGTPLLHEDYKQTISPPPLTSITSMRPITLQSPYSIPKMCLFDHVPLVDIEYIAAPNIRVAKMGTLSLGTTHVRGIFGDGRSFVKGEGMRGSSVRLVPG